MRFRSAAKASHKEMLPIAKKPVIQYAAEEVVASGIIDMIFITVRNKRAIKDGFDQADELEAELATNNGQALLDILRDIRPDHVKCSCIRRAETLALGHAALCAERLMQDEPFALILADDLLDADVPVLSQMAVLYDRYGTSITGAEAASDRNEALAPNAA
jgi:UTP--glucose-1-phosphate uridylyltransferase